MTARKLVVHCKREPFDVYIGRPGPWGNPFSHLPNTLARYRTRTREEAIRLFEQHALKNPEYIMRVRRELRGKVLGCWCDPHPCHWHFLARIANE